MPPSARGYLRVSRMNRYDRGAMTDSMMMNAGPYARNRQPANNRAVIVELGDRLPRG